MGHGPTINKVDLIAAIYQNDGVVAWTARKMGNSEQAIWAFADRDSEVQQAIDNARAKKRKKYLDLDEEHLQEAHNSIQYLLKSNDTTATIFTLKALGKYNDGKNTSSGSITVNTIDYSKAV
jgi:hypothetical protein